MEGCFKLEGELKRICLDISAGCAAFALAGATAWAQTTAQISGTVKDQSGAVLPGVEVSATQTATGAKRTTVTNETGSYGLASLPIGPYMLEASLPRFKSYVQSGIVLQLDESPIINVVLQVGQVSEQVEVQANAGLVETQRTAIGQVVTNKQIAELPLNGRDPHELIFLAGMATTPGIGSMNSIRNYPTVVVSVAGGNGDGVPYLLDGSIWQDPYNSLSMSLPFPDALQEFKVETSAMRAQYGFHATATVNAVTKSGSNEFHGDLFEFVRNAILNARDAFAAERDTDKRNQFGGVIGGPIKKDKLFFFGGYQRTSLRSDGIQNTAFIPTPAALNGDFTFGAGNASPGAQHNGPMPSVIEDLSWIKGSHQFGFGGAIYQQRLNYWSGTNGVGTAMFDGSTTGLVLGDFMMGRPLTFNQGTVYGFYTRQFYESLYAKDN